VPDTIANVTAPTRTGGQAERMLTDWQLRAEPGPWPLERVLFALAGTMTLLAAALAALVSPWFLLLAVFVGVNQWLYVLVGACPASIVLRRALHLRSAIYENDDRVSA
jgi:hypothetical protein